MTRKAKGKLIIIGGHEDKEGAATILEAVAQEAKKGTLVIMTVATQLPGEMAEEYATIFQRMGVKKIEVVDINTREDGRNKANVEKVAAAAVLFFTGGDQLRITSQIGDSLVFQTMHEIYQKGATIVGTSAGAAAMPETMLIAGPSDESNRVSALVMAPGLGLIPGVVIDSHFAERGRMGRLLGAVAQNPRNLGIGIDEDTAITVEANERFTVMGSGAVYVVDGSTVTFSSISEKNPDNILSIHDVKLHVLGENDCFNMVDRQPLIAKAIVKELEGRTNGEHAMA
jgi:cyanophycinase